MKTESRVPLSDLSPSRKQREDPEYQGDLLKLRTKYDKSKMKNFIDDLKSRCHNLVSQKTVPQSTPLE